MLFLWEGRRKSLRRPSGFDPELSCFFSGPPPFVLILSVLGFAEAEVVFFYFSPGRVEQADVNADLIVVVVPCRCAVACLSQFVVQPCNAFWYVRRGVVGSNGACVGVRVGRSNDDGSNMAVVCMCSVFFCAAFVASASAAVRRCF